MTDKNSVQVYTDWLEDFEELEPHQAQTLICAILRYQMGEELPEMDATTKAAWRSMRRQIERDNDAYEEKCETNRQNGAKGGRPKKETENRTVSEKTERLSEKPNGFIEKPKKPDTDTDKDTDTDINNTPHIPPEGGKRFVPPTVDEVRAYCIERKNSIDPENFFDFYVSKGWKVGNQPMKDWKACVRTWEKRRKEETKKNKQTDFNQFAQRDNDWASMEKQLLGWGG